MPSKYRAKVERRGKVISEPLLDLSTVGPHCPLVSGLDWQAGIKAGFESHNLITGIDGKYGPGESKIYYTAKVVDVAGAHGPDIRVPEPTSPANLQQVIDAANERLKSCACPLGMTVCQGGLNIWR